MALTDVQRLLTRLHTDDGLRERFFADPERTGREEGLSAEEAAGLAGLDRRQVERFAASLKAKRLLEASKLLPHTARALGERLRPLFLEYARHPIPGGTHRHRWDAPRFVEHLEREPGIPAWTAELARYEAAWLLAASGRCLVVRRFRYPVDKIAGELEGETVRALGPDPGPDPKPVPTCCLWLRLPGRPGLRAWALTPRSRRRLA